MYFSRLVFNLIIILKLRIFDIKITGIFDWKDKIKAFLLKKYFINKNNETNVFENLLFLIHVFEFGQIIFIFLLKFFL